MKKIGIMGGTFNPIHNGHLLLAEMALEAERLDEVWFIPTGVSYLKEHDNVLCGKERLRMVELATMGNPLFRTSEVEIQRGGYTYTYETLETLHKEFPEHQFYFIMGADSLKAFERWKKPDCILKNSILLVAVRGEVSIEVLSSKCRELMERFGGEIKMFPFEKIEISSTEIRNRVREGKGIGNLVPATVEEYILEKRFYHE